MEKIFRDNRYKSILAMLCALGWSLAYPLIKIGYQEFRIDGIDLGSKILFAGIRFFFAGVLVLVFCGCRKIKMEMQRKQDYLWLLLLAVVNTSLHYMFAYIGLGYNSSARSTILDSMSGFILIMLSTLIFADDNMTKNKLLGCILGIMGIISINLQPGVDFWKTLLLWEME